MPLTKETVRRLMLEKQGFGERPASISKKNIFDAVDRLGCLQIDTINVVERAHYLTLWSRLGNYDKELLHQLAYVDRRLFEYWAHAACYVPMKEFRYYARPMRIRREKYADGYEWARAEPEVMELVLERVRKEGSLSAKDFEHRRKTRSQGWWDWKPAKIALEALFGAGILLVSRRENFQRYYDLSERVLPPSVDSTEPTEEECIRFHALRTLGCLGLASPGDLRTYFQPWSIMLRRTSKQWQAILEDLVEEGKALSFEVEGERNPYYCLAEDSQQVEDSGSEFNDVRLLNNFDNLIWNRKQIQNLFGFEVKLEAYIPAAKRRYGYYNLPILYGDRFVGRIVPKMDRKRGTLIVHSVWHEPWLRPDEDFENKFTGTLQEFAEFHGVDEIEMEEDAPRKG
ncbi:MAG: YcaQ family DNA glycosylase [Candidatus Bathyarchaeota archaeon]|nr:MAG: YcaQ family DNA glycosylase [Candidatus Bathyarchaeota archaeon]